MSFEKFVKRYSRTQINALRQAQDPSKDPERNRGTNQTQIYADNLRKSALKINFSFESLVKRISPTLKRIAYKLNGHFSFFNDEDLFQEALMHLWGDFQEGKLTDKTDSYILQGCYFHLKNYIRKVQDKAPLVSIDALMDGDSRDLEEILPRENPQYHIERLDNNLLLQHIQNNGFTKREKEVLSLCLEGLTTREIGQRLGVSHVRIVKIKASVRRKANNLLDSNAR